MLKRSNNSKKDTLILVCSLKNQRLLNHWAVDKFIQLLQLQRCAICTCTKKKCYAQFAFFVLKRTF